MARMNEIVINILNAFNRKITEFLNAKEDQTAAFNKLKAERDAAKASIVAKAIERIMQAQVRMKTRPYSGSIIINF